MPTVEPQHEIGLSEHVSRFIAVEGLEARLEALPRVMVPRRAHLPRAKAEKVEAVFVEHGLVRLYGSDETTKEHTLHFGLEGWWVCDWQAFFASAASPMAIQAVEDTRLVVLTLEDYEQLLEDCPSLEKYFRQVFARSTAALQHRIWLGETRSAAALYEHFRNKNAGFLQRVPQYMLASYLGFTAEFFSKLRSRNGS